MPLARVGARTESTTRLQLQREAWPISRARALAPYAMARAHSKQDTHYAVLYCTFGVCTLVLFINLRRACAARVTVLGLSVCLSDLSGTTGNKAVRERYTRLQRNNRSKNNVADLAKTSKFLQEKPAPPWTKFRDPIHQLSRCACVFITCTTGSLCRQSQHRPGVLRCCKCYFKCR